MIQPRLEVAEVFREFTPAFLYRYGEAISPDQRRVLWDVARCRTAELGGHVEECDHCGHRQIAYNSCRNRHCPKCQAATRAQWLEERSAELLPVEYFHVVFTLPHEIGPLALQNQRRIYGMLFQAAAESLLTIAADPRHLGAQIGFLAVLHTWGQNLHLHPHVHCVVPGGGLSPDQRQWIACRPGFFLPVRVLSRLFRAKFLSFLRDAYDRQQILFHGQQRHLEDPALFRQLVAALREKEWVVYAKPPFGGSPEIVLKYLVPGVLHPPGGNLQLPLDRHRGWQSPFLLEGLCGREPAKDHGAGWRRVHSPLPPARRAVRVYAHPPFRIPGPWASNREAGVVPKAAEC